MGIKERRERQRREVRGGILDAARGIAVAEGWRSVTIRKIAERIEYSPPVIYEHFDSKDELVAEYLRCLARSAGKFWEELQAAHPEDPRAQLRGWLAAMQAHVLDTDRRGCALANAAVELPEKEHPARCVIEQYKNEQRSRLVRLCAVCGVDEPELLADELFLLLEGAHVSAQSLGPNGPASRLVRMGEAVIASHIPASAAAR